MTGVSDTAALAAIGAAARELKLATVRADRDGSPFLAFGDDLEE